MITAPSAIPIGHKTHSMEVLEGLEHLLVVTSLQETVESMVFMVLKSVWKLKL